MALPARLRGVRRTRFRTGVAMPAGTPGSGGEPGAVSSAGHPRQADADGLANLAQPGTKRREPGRSEAVGLSPALHCEWFNEPTLIEASQCAIQRPGAEVDTGERLHVAHHRVPVLGARREADHDQQPRILRCDTHALPLLCYVSRTTWRVASAGRRSASRCAG